MTDLEFILKNCAEMTRLYLSLQKRVETLEAKVDNKPNKEIINKIPKIIPMKIEKRG